MPQLLDFIMALMNYFLTAEIKISQLLTSVYTSIFFRELYLNLHKQLVQHLLLVDLPLVLSPIKFRKLSVNHVFLCAQILKPTIKQSLSLPMSTFQLLLCAILIPHQNMLMLLFLATIKVFNPLEQCGGCWHVR